MSYSVTEKAPIVVGDAGIEMSATNVYTARTEEVSNDLSVMTYFPSAVYTIIRRDFLNVARTVSMEYLKQRQRDQPKLDPLYPVYQSENLFNDNRMRPFVDYVGATIWNVLNGQGYNMSNISVAFYEMWCQEHHKHSAMDEHVHNRGAQMVGFYFLDVPENSSRIVIHDPRPAKKQINLPETDISQVTYASDAVNFTPEPGMLFLANSWLPHSFGRHGGSKPIRFIHFTAGVVENAAQVTNAPNII